MVNQATCREFNACEKLIIAEKDYFYKHYGLRRMMKKRSGFNKMRFIISPLARLGMIGFITIYFIVAIKNRKFGVSVFREKLIFNDHNSHLIKKRIFNEYQAQYEESLSYKYLFCPLFVFIRLHSLVSISKSYKRSQPVSPAAFFSLSEFWVYYFTLYYVLPKNNFTGVLVNDDLSERSYALILAAKDAGLRTGIVTLADEIFRVPFERYDVLFCWNYAQALEVKSTYSLVSHLNRSYRPIRQLTVVNDQKCNVGIALKSSALFDENGFKRLIEELSARLWVRQIYVRFHPGTKPVNYFPDNKNITYNISDGSSKEFFETIEVLFSGSTSLVKEALLAGVPVAYVASLDKTAEKDAYSYVSKGIIYNLEYEHIDINVLEQINKFYQETEWKEMRNQWIEHDPEAVPIGVALEHLLH